MKLSLEFGAFAAPLAEQFTAQGLTPPKHLVKFEQHAIAIARLTTHGLIPDRAAATARRRLLRRIMEDMAREAPS